jgi:hypothetical protein
MRLRPDDLSDEPWTSTEEVRVLPSAASAQEAAPTLNTSAMAERTCQEPGCTTKIKRGRRCRACYYAKAQRRPRLYRGACVCGCGRTAGGRSGMARRCYLRMLHRRKAFKRVMKQLVGIPLPAEHLALALRSITPPVRSIEMDRALRALVGLLEGLEDGRVIVARYRPQPASVPPPAAVSSPS